MARKKPFLGRTENELNLAANLSLQGNKVSKSNLPDAMGGTGGDGYAPGVMGSDPIPLVSGEWGPTYEGGGSMPNPPDEAAVLASAMSVLDGGKGDDEGSSILSFLDDAPNKIGEIGEKVSDVTKQGESVRDYNNERFQAAANRLKQNDLETPNPIVKDLTGTLGEAQRNVKKYSGGKIQLDDPRMETFANQLSRAPGNSLDPGVIAAWVTQEGGNTSYGDNNFLNIGQADSGPYGPANEADKWDTPEEGAHWTNEFLHDRYGGPSESIAGILEAAKGKAPLDQIQAIANTNWAGDPNYGANITRNYESLPPVAPAQPNKLNQAKDVYEAAERRADQFGVETGPVTQYAGIEDPNRKNKLNLAGEIIETPKGPNRAELVDLGKEWGIYNVPKGQKVPMVNKLPGELDGAQRAVQMLLGAQVTGDKEPGHSSGGYHDPANPDAYAQDIPLGSSSADEGEPVYNQDLLDKVSRRYSRLTGQPNPNLTEGQGYTNLDFGPYTLEIIPDSATNIHGSGAHGHFGAEYDGEGKIPLRMGPVSLMQIAKAQAATGDSGGGEESSGGGGGYVPPPSGGYTPPPAGQLLGGQGSQGLDTLTSLWGGDGGGPLGKVHEILDIEPTTIGGYIPDSGLDDEELTPEMIMELLRQRQLTL